MSTWKVLPNEILNLIFGILAKDHCKRHSLKVSDLEQCQLTCKNWSKVAKRHLYQRVLIRESDQLKQCLTALSLSKSNPGYYVKHIFISHWETAIEFIQQLLLMCPNLERLDGPPAANGHVFEQLQKACERGACKHLAYTPIFNLGSTEAENKQYYDALYCLRRSLKLLHLDESLVVNSNITPSFLLQRLTEFPNLQSLSLRVTSLGTVRRVVHCIEDCPDLEVLDLGWRSRGFRSEKDMALDIHSVTPCLTVKQLSLRFFRVTKNLLEYIMDTFPNLDHFSFLAVSLYEDPNDSTTKITNDLWVRFLVYACTRVRRRLQLLYLEIHDKHGVLADFFDTMRSYENIHINHLNNYHVRDVVNIESYNPNQNQATEEQDDLYISVS